MKKLILPSVVCFASLFLASCASDWDYFWHGDGTPYVPATSTSGYSSGYTAPAPQPYSAVESQAQKDRNYNDYLDRKLNDAVH